MTDLPKVIYLHDGQDDITWSEHEEIEGVKYIRADKALKEIIGEGNKCFELLDDVLGAMQGYQKASGSDRADWDFSDEIEHIQEFLQ